LIITEEGLSLIRRSEGFRASAYRDAAGVWTIGFGHTSEAGPPRVRSGTRITRKEAMAILARDVETFANGVRGLLKRELAPAQFTALVSFAYNVGLTNFRRSSVLTAVNAGDFDAVPRRLQLWVKCRGRILPGLVNRRAAEAAMFVAETSASHDPLPPAPIEEPIEPISGTPLRHSSTGMAALLSGAAGLVSSLAASLGEVTEAAVRSPIVIAATLVILAAALWIIRERRLKSREDGV
jgi:lysozyme